MDGKLGVVLILGVDVFGRYCWDGVRVARGVLG